YAERKPGALKIPAQKQRDPIVARPPAGALILKVYQSALHPDARGELRRQAHAYPEEYGDAVPYEPGHDYVWLTAPEWKSLLPARLCKGKRLAVPAPVAQQLAFMLRDTSRLGSTDPSVTWKPRDMQSRDLKLIVESVSPVVRLRLEGSIRLQETVKEPSKGRARYDGHLLGYLDYDATKKAFVRFDVIAVGKFQGWRRTGRPDGSVKLTKPYVLGVAFEARDVALAVPSNWGCRGK